MVAQVTPTKEEWQAHLLTMVERVEPEEDRDMMMEKYAEYFSYERFCSEQNALREHILQIVADNIHGDMHEANKIVDEMNDSVAQLIIDLTSTCDDLENNLQEFWDIELPEVWAI